MQESVLHVENTAEVQGSLDLSNVIKSAVFIYIGGLVTNILGFVFWLVASSYVPPDVVGSASAIIALQALLMTIMTIGLPTGLRRFVGKGGSEERYDLISEYFATSMGVNLLLNLPVSLILIAAPALHYSGYGLSAIELAFVGTLILLSFWAPTLVSLFDSLLKTEITALAQVLSSIVKLLLGLMMLILGYGFLGVMMAFIAASITTDSVLLYHARNMFREFGYQPRFESDRIRELVESGLPAWIPNMLTIAGQSVAVLVIYGLVGESQTGLYYLAFAMAQVVYTIPTSIQSLMYPVLSGMKSGREDAIRRTTRVSLIATAPIALAVALYSEIPFSVIGPAYSDAGPLLAILVVGAMFWSIYVGYYGYLYAIKEYRHVTGLGLVLNGTRLALYFLLASLFGAMGVAFSFIGGILVAMIGLAFSSISIGYKPDWKKYFLAIIIPSTSVILVWHLSVEWILGIPFILIWSFILYGRLKIMTRTDIFEVFCGLFTPEKALSIALRLRPVSRIVFGKQNVDE
ncbi:MAG: hypothetical protein EAX81_01270 [Candidatus Thorarchaeota archaeon]|nr:hypothetical protein [Candidatus Thorarchaeota archaeon]